MSLILMCSYPIDVPATFLVKIKKEVLIDVLARKVRKELKGLGINVLLTDVSLYKTDINLEPLGDLKSRALRFLHEHQEEALSRLGNVGEFFPDAPITQVHILVVTPEVMEYLEIIDNPKANYARKIRKDLDEKVKKKLPSKIAPSFMVRSSRQLSSFFSGNVYKNHLPAALFNGPLGRLQQRFGSDWLPDESTIQMAREYIALATESYPNEKDRQFAIKLPIEGMLGPATGWNKKLRFADDIEPDACWLTASGEFSCTILELKNTPGLEGDPIFQCIADLGEIVASSRYDPHRGWCNFPTVLIGLAGARIQVSIAVYIGALFISDLWTVDLAAGVHASATTIQLARTFGAISMCCRELEAYFNRGRIHPSSQFDISFLYPHPIATDGTLIPSIKYDKYLGLDGSPVETLSDLGQRHTVLYTGFLDDGKPVVIKFMPFYNEDAHTLLAEAGLAPQLHFCNPIVGDLVMVVMEDIRGAATSVRQLMQGHRCPRLSHVILKEVKRAVKLLHDADMVFGDLREGNILYSNDQETGQERIVLVDFDCAGVAGKSRYPATILNTAGGWEPGVFPCGIMEKVHDLWQIQHLERVITTVS
ncbi:hypothetical protein DFP72DRAFT_1020092 [Ephemerocybe angulata]|uniref:Protein kinase domain-containing protein n=1 Tax=Ephemerocybe angulata TaxID=980116 RepID=A0A8H6LWV7_9AGAR|nr:hypothetical protein DFP72DRAFT_1020092 [Tulosesus angulatus]